MSNYAERVAKRLDEVYRTNSMTQARELDSLRLILLSDLHKGGWNSIDDFKKCEPTYLAALDHYWQQGFEIWLLGDMEELWKNRPKPVIAAYHDVLNRERAYAEAPSPPRYLRLVGNHDDRWYNEAQVCKYLGSFLAGKPVLEAVRLAVLDQGEKLGEILFVHGHQGTLASEKFAGASALIIRYLWRPLQLVFKLQTPTPSTDPKLRQKHELAMYDYAVNRPGLVLVAGHTHHPVWVGMGLRQAMQAMQTMQATPDTPAAPAAQVSPMAEAAWMQAEYKEGVSLPGDKPCYFNTGCCCNPDGSITGIEIEAGEIRLVRWENPAQPLRQEVFPPAQLRDVLARVA